MKFFLHFTYVPDYPPGNVTHNWTGRMWSACFVEANSQKHAKEIADKHMSEFSFPYLVELKPEPPPHNRTKDY